MYAWCCSFVCSTLNATTVVSVVDVDVEVSVSCAELLAMMWFQEPVVFGRVVLGSRAEHAGDADRRRLCSRVVGDRQRRCEGSGRCRRVFTGKLWSSYSVHRPSMRAVSVSGANSESSSS